MVFFMPAALPLPSERHLPGGSHVTSCEPRPPAEATRKRSLSLANLRGFAILMVLSFHSFIAYVENQPAATPPFDAPPYGWMVNPIVDAARWLGFDLYCALQYSYLMHLMFFLSGLFVWPSLVAKGARGFLAGRLLRLGLPWLLGVYLLTPLAYYPVYLATAADPGWPAFWSHWLALPFWPSGPLWFLGVLWTFNLVIAAVYWLAPQTGKVLAALSAGSRDRPGRYFLALLVLSAIAYVPLARFFKPWQWVDFGPFAMQPSFVLPYAIFFLAGAGIGALGIESGLVAQGGALARRWRLWLGAAPFAFIAWIGPTALIVEGYAAKLPGMAILADLGLVLTATTSSFALLALFARFADRPSPVLGRLSENAYGIYLVHYVFVIWLQYALVAAPLPAVAKAAVVLAGTLALSWATVSLFATMARRMVKPRRLAKAG
jgi:peptidoglycan/LPS O-acetylase OafA/YrhL